MRGVEVMGGTTSRTRRGRNTELQGQTVTSGTDTALITSVALGWARPKLGLSSVSSEIAWSSAVCHLAALPLGYLVTSNTDVEVTESSSYLPKMEVVTSGCHG